MKIMGIDPGLGRTGWSIIDENKGKLEVLHYGCVETRKEDSEEKRLLQIYKEVFSLISQKSPSVLSIEKLFFNKNVTNALSVGQARGVVILAAVQRGVEVREYTPLQVKIAVTGYGRAEKNQIGHMVKNILRLNSVPKPDDAADALAIALTHAVSYKINSLG